MVRHGPADFSFLSLPHGLFASLYPLHFPFYVLYINNFLSVNDKKIIATWLFEIFESRSNNQARR